MCFMKQAIKKKIYAKVSFEQNGGHLPCGLCHAKAFLWAYADSEGPDQPAHQCSLIKAFAVR